MEEVSTMLKEIKERKPPVIVKMVLWPFPPRGWVKMNTDGVSRGNPSIIAYAYYIRKEEGQLIHAATDKLEDSTNIEAEIKAIYYGVEYCRQHNINNVIIETDSLVVHNMLQGEVDVMWSLIYQITHIKKFMKNIGARTQHIYREGNGLADFLANYVVDVHSLEIDTFGMLPPEGHELMNQDNLQTPYLRTRTKKGYG